MFQSTIIFSRGNFIVKLPYFYAWYTTNIFNENRMLSDEFDKIKLSNLEFKENLKMD